MPQLSNVSNAGYKIGGVSFTSTSNTINFNLLIGSLTLQKSMSPSQGIVGATVDITVVVTNTEIALAVTDFVFTDNLTAQGFTYVPGTCKINGVSTLDSPQTGVTIASIPLLGVRTITFQATVNAP